MAWDIVRLVKSHDRTAFSCGAPSLDVFLRQFATQYEKRNYGRTYVLIQDGRPEVRGHYTLAAGQIPKAGLPKAAAKKLPDRPVPVALLARLAVDHSVRGQGLGRMLLANAVSRCAEMAEQIGIHAVFVEAIDEAAAEFYRKHDFTALIDQPFRLFMPVSQITAGG